MKALRWYGQKDVRIEDVPEPSPGAGEVKVKVKWCGICASDVHEYTSGPLFIPTKKPHPLTGRKAPIILGHEFSGEVVETGSQVKSISVGDKVAVRPTIPCYECHWCRSGRHILCARLATLGLGADGGFAEFVIAPEDCIYRLPGQVSYEIGTFCEPTAVAIHACRKAMVSPGDTTAVVGCGAIGLLVVQATRATGASTVYAIEPNARRRSLAEKLGATVTFDPDRMDAGREIAKLTDGLRVDVAFECAGVPAAMLTALSVTGRGGKIIEVGQMMEPCEFPFQRLFCHDKSIIASQGYENEFPTAISFLSESRVICEPLITVKIKLDNIIEQGIKVLTSERKGEHIRILVSPVS
jgi:(R,R)-butanediol dehydrogenase/meso-butanediol dehydrogenase/diacetyl reductase